jgi:hypothetical protein
LSDTLSSGYYTLILDFIGISHTIDTNSPARVL